MKCARCGKTTSFVSGSFCSYCGALISSSEASAFPLPPPSSKNDIPWESQMRSDAPLKALYLTFREILFHPDNFFKTAVEVQHQNSIFPSLWYGLFAGIIGMIATWAWYEIFTKFGQSYTNFSEIFGNTFVTPPMLIAAPLLILFEFLIIAAYISFVMRFCKCQRPSLGHIIRILCYAESTSVLQVIPGVGSLLSMLFGAYLLLTGFHHLFSASRIKVALLILLPLIVIVVLLVIILAAGLIGGVIAGAGFLQQWQSILK